MERTTLERLFTILAMVLGVVSFTFVVSNINSIISQNKKQIRMKAKNLICLAKIKEDLKLSDELINMATKEISQSTHEISAESFKEMIIKFPREQQKKLFYCMYREKLHSINMFRVLSPDVIILLGQVISSIIYMPSTR